MGLNHSIDPIQKHNTMSPILVTVTGGKLPHHRRFLGLVTSLELHLCDLVRQAPLPNRPHSHCHAPSSELTRDGGCEMSQLPNVSARKSRVSCSESGHRQRQASEASRRQCTVWSALTRS